MNGITMQNTAAMAQSFLARMEMSDRAVAGNGETIFLLRPDQFLQYRSAKQHGPSRNYPKDRSDTGADLPSQFNQAQRRLLNPKKNGGTDNGNEIKI